MQVPPAQNRPRELKISGSPCFYAKNVWFHLGKDPFLFLLSPYPTYGKIAYILTIWQYFFLKGLLHWKHSRKLQLWHMLLLCSGPQHGSEAPWSRAQSTCQLSTGVQDTMVLSVTGITGRNQSLFIVHCFRSWSGNHDGNVTDWKQVQGAGWSHMRYTSAGDNIRGAETAPTIISAMLR